MIFLDTDPSKAGKKDFLISSLKSWKEIISTIIGTGPQQLALVGLIA
jgi:hypothetical protein